MEGSLKGKLLIALPTLKDPLFERAVILLCAHNEEHAMGIVINHAMTDIGCNELFDQLGMQNAPSTQVPLLLGGPVCPERGFVLHSDDYDAEGATASIMDGVCLTATEDVLLALASDTPPEKAVLALGYAGWGEGQLEEEIMENVWLVADASEALIYDKSYNTKWNRALASIGVSPENLNSQAGHA
ncbi:YqgE/AlgH family protein [Hirschia baltica]|uniref:UPF0301 protein Hbal_1034 n=1 Tax=Hirschia baltica (strain ATCC 49814 / DSM 5838 / IFAM 1418) TaxID=582402 RepID=C6XR96_HIRBI|nr:protein of unknown function DUF179 [Hirschia baltica ATCC 49814]